MDDPDIFDLTGPLPQGTTLLEASAGTGKTFTVAGLVTRYLAEGVATIDQLLVVTFGRAASNELRERVRTQLVEAAEALADPESVRPGANLLVDWLIADVEQRTQRRERLITALAGFDTATIATTHQFCQVVLRSLGVAGDSDLHDTLVESLDDLVSEVVDDLYLARYGDAPHKPPFSRAAAYALARRAVDDGLAQLAGLGLDAPDSPPAQRVDFAAAVRAEVERRKRRRGVLSYDDLLSRLATALTGPEGDPRPTAACTRMRERWKVVLVDEFQDTDPTQWEILRRAFHAHATMVLIGDPKQAIYAFRGGDVVTYLRAANLCDRRATLGTNWRTDAGLVAALGVMLGGAALGDEAIAVREVEAHHRGSRLRDAPSGWPLRVRRVPREGRRLTKRGELSAANARELIAADCAADIAELLSSSATWDGRAIRAADVAVIVSVRDHGLLVQRHLARWGISAVVAGGTHLLTTPAADEWMVLLDAIDQPHRPGLVRAVALTSFFGHTHLDLATDAADELVDAVADQLRAWGVLLRTRGVAAVLEAADAAGLSARVLSRPGGERLLTDLRQIGQVLHAAAVRLRMSQSALVAWLRDERRRSETSERPRRLDSDVAAVQIVTVHASKGLQYPITYLPFLYQSFRFDADVALFHQPGQDGPVRSIDVRSGGQGWSGHLASHEVEEEGEDLRRLYVALTRAQSQVVTWWASTQNTEIGPLHRMLLGRQPGEPQVPPRVAVRDDDYTARILDLLTELGALQSEVARIRPEVHPFAPPGVDESALSTRSFDRDIDTRWRRTSYSALVRVVDHGPGVVSEPEDLLTDDEPQADEAASAEATGQDGAMPMAGLPAGAAFGTLVHAVLEQADPQRDNLVAVLREAIDDELTRQPVDVDPDALAVALAASCRAPLGSVLDELTLAEIALGDRLCELDFELPLAGGDGAVSSASTPEVRLRDLAPLLRRWLPEHDPLASFADRLEHPVLGDQPLRGYLTGSIDVVIRLGAGSTQRFVVVDYKTNRLTPPGEVASAEHYAPSRLAASMLGSDYPLQALLYAVVVHRYLRWRLAEYDPERHLGGVAYLYLRGMAPDLPRFDGDPAGVFGWRPPSGLIVALSDLLDGVGR